MKLANTLAYYDTATITAVKSFIVQAPGGTAVGATTLGIMTLSLTTLSITDDFIRTES